MDAQLLEKLHRRRSVVDVEGEVWDSRPQPSNADAISDWLYLDAFTEDWELLVSAGEVEDVAVQKLLPTGLCIDDSPSLIARLRKMDRDTGHNVLRALPESRRRELQVLITTSGLPQQVTQVDAYASASSRSAGSSMRRASNSTICAAPDLVKPFGAAVLATSNSDALGVATNTAAVIAPLVSALPDSNAEDGEGGYRGGAGGDLARGSVADAEQIRAAQRQRVERERAAFAADCARRWPALLKVSVDATFQTKAASEEKAAEDFMESHDLRALRADVARTRGHDPAFKNSESPARLEKMLVKFCSQEGIRYMQGLHEVAAVFIFIQANAAVDSGFDENVALACLASFTHLFTPYFHDGESFVALHVSLLFFRQLLLYHHPDLHNHLAEAGVSPFLYAMPWFITLFASRTPMSVLLRFWDLYIQRNNSPFLHFIALAVLSDEKAAILEVDQEDAHSSALRIGIRTNEQLDSLWKAAELLQARTPKSLPLRLSRVLAAVKEKRGQPASAEKPWSERVLERVEKEGSFSMLPEEVAVQLVREEAALTSSSAPALRFRLLVVDVRSREEYAAENLPQAMHFHPPCLAKLVVSSRQGGRSRLERVANSFSLAVAGSRDGNASAPTGGTSAHRLAWADPVMIAEIFEALRVAASERWGEGWNSASAALHIVLLGGSGDVLGGVGAAAPLYEVLTEHLALARVSIALGGAPAVHREAVRRGLRLQSQASASPSEVTSRAASAVLGSAWSRLQAASESGQLKSLRDVAKGLAERAEDAVNKVREQAPDIAAAARQRASEGISAVLQQIEKLDNPQLGNHWVCQGWFSAFDDPPSGASGDIDAGGQHERPRIQLQPAALHLTDQGALEFMESQAVAGASAAAVLRSFEVSRLERIGLSASRPDVLSFYFERNVPMTALTKTDSESGAQLERRRPSLVARFSSSDRARACARAIASASKRARKPLSPPASLLPPVLETGVSTAAVDDVCGGGYPKVPQAARVEVAPSINAIGEETVVAEVGVGLCRGEVVATSEVEPDQDTEDFLRELEHMVLVP